MSRPIRTRSILLGFALVGLFAGGLSGCLSATKTPAQGGVVDFSLARSARMDVTPKQLDEVGKAADRQSALKDLIHTDLVVNVGLPGDYTLGYTNRAGAVMHASLTGLIPGVARVVNDVDPFASAALRSGDAVKASRAPVTSAWWHAGDLPFGFSLATGSAATYNLRTEANEEVSALGLATNDSKARIDELTFGMHIPVTGTASYSLGAETPDGAPLRLKVDYAVPKTSVPLLAATLTGAKDGKVGHAGIRFNLDEAVANAAATFWWRGGEPLASQFDGAHWRVAPSVTAWADGGFAGDGEDGFSCAGKTQADACHPKEFSTSEGTQEATPRENAHKEDFPKATNPEDQQALAFLSQVFAQDVAPGDVIDLVMSTSENDFGDGFSDSRFTVRNEYILSAVGDESLTVPAGTFNALKLTFTTILDVNAASLHAPAQQTYDAYPAPAYCETGAYGSQSCEPPSPSCRPGVPCSPSQPAPPPSSPQPRPPSHAAPGPQILSNFRENETLSRTTIWLDAKSYQPLKVTNEFPFDVQRMYTNLLSHLDGKFWEDAGVNPVTSSQLKMKVAMTSTAEAAQLTPGAVFSAVDGLALAQILSVAPAGGPMAFVAMGIGGAGFGSSSSDPGQPQHEPFGSIALSSAGPIDSTTTPGSFLKSYTIASSSDSLTYGQLMFSVNGRMFSFDTMHCPPGGGAAWSACGDATARTPQDHVQPGDVVTLRTDSNPAGSTLRIIDGHTNSVMLTLTIG